MQRRIKKSHILYSLSPLWRVWIPVSSLWYPQGFCSLLPKSNFDLFFVSCFHHLDYFLFCPICNGWTVSLKRPLNPSKETERQEGRKSPWEQMRVELSARQISFWGLVYRHAQQIFEVVIVMHYLVKAGKGRITNGRQCPIITASPEEHRRVKLAHRHNQRAQCT